MISILIPAYNSSATIKEALDSVRAQAFADCEVIVVDDASTDGTTAVAESAMRLLQVSGFRFQVLKLRSNSGPAAARNRGIAEAKGEWIAFLDADDAWLPDRLRVQMECVRQNPDVAMVCGETLPFENGSSVASPSREGTADVVLGRASVPASRRLVLDDFINGNPVATSTVLVRKDAVLTVGGFDEQFRGPEDYDLWMRITARCPVIRLDMPLARYRRIADSLSMNERKFIPQVIKVIDKAFGDGGVFAGRSGKRKAIARQILAGSWSAAERGDMGWAASLFIRSIFVWPFSLDGDSGLAWARAKLVVYFLKRMFCKVHVKCN